MQRPTISSECNGVETSIESVPGDLEFPKHWRDFEPIRPGNEGPIEGWPNAVLDGNLESLRSCLLKAIFGVDRRAKRRQGIGERQKGKALLKEPNALVAQLDRATDF